METRRFRTHIGTKYAEKNRQLYVMWRINGIKTAICDYPNWDNYSNDEKFIYSTTVFTRCTEEQYETFKKIVETIYPGLCEFDE